MSVIDADVLDASPLFPDVENEPKVADDALIDVSNSSVLLDVSPMSTMARGSLTLTKKP